MILYTGLNWQESYAYLKAIKTDYWGVELIEFSSVPNDCFYSSLFKMQDRKRMEDSMRVKKHLIVPICEVFLSGLIVFYYTRVTCKKQWWSTVSQTVQNIS